MAIFEFFPSDVLLFVISAAANQLFDNFICIIDVPSPVADWNDTK